MLDFQQLLDCYRYQTPRIASTANKEPQLENGIYSEISSCAALLHTLLI